MTKRKDKEETENNAPDKDNQHDDNISDISKESTYEPRKKKAKTRSSVSVTK